jgi:hypothetical protein
MMRTVRRVGFLVVLLPALGLLAPGRAAPTATDLRFEVTLARGLLSAATDGRLLVVLARKKEPEPRTTIGETSKDTPPVLGRDVTGLSPTRAILVDQRAAIFPLTRLAQLPAGDYFAQAVFTCNRDLRRPDAPGNLYSDPLPVKLDPARGTTVRLRLTRRVAEETPPEDDYVKYVKIRSERLTRFHGRPMLLRAGVILPAGHARERDRRYPLRVHIGGYGTRYTAVSEMMAAESPFRRAWLAKGAPRMLLLHLDGAGPFGDPYQVDSANNGPYGAAITEELIPHVEKLYRGVGRGHARVLAGASTGGWVSLALQVFYPDFFNGAWAHAPDPVDFRAFELVNIYKDANAFVNAYGFNRPASRDLDGDVRTTMRYELRLERVLGRGDNWTLSGKDWAAWNAAFGPRGADGLPKPLWDGRTGKIDRTVTEHWQKYDLRLRLQKDWAVLGPKLRGKLRIWVGEADDYFLNNAVHLLDDFLKRAKPAFEGKITFGPRQGHSWSALTERQMLAEMAAAVAGKR